MLRWPCSLYPASPGRMTAYKSPGLLLASPPVHNSTARECAFSYEAHDCKSTKDKGTSHHPIALKLRQHFLSQFIDRDNCHCSSHVCYFFYCISGPKRGCRRRGWIKSGHPNYKGSALKFHNIKNKMTIKPLESIMQGSSQIVFNSPETSRQTPNASYSCLPEREGEGGGGGSISATGGDAAAFREGERG